MTFKLKKTLKTIKFYTVTLPLVLLTIPIGFIFEYIITFPFIIFCTLDGLGQEKKTKNNSQQTPP